MTIPKAIEILMLYEHSASSLPRGDFLDAIQLGLEALTRFKALRHAAKLPGVPWLHSETTTDAS